MAILTRTGQSAALRQALERPQCHHVVILEFLRERAAARVADVADIEIVAKALAKKLLPGPLRAVVLFNFSKF